MKAMVLTGPGELILDDVAKPARGSRDVLVRVDAQRDLPHR